MNLRDGSWADSVFLVGMVLVTSAGARGDEARVEGDGPIYAKTMVVLRISVPRVGDVRGVSLLLSKDGDNYEIAKAGLPRSWHLFRSISYQGETATVVVPIVGRFGRGVYEFMFGGPGTYYLRWGVGFEDKTVQGYSIDQVVDVEPARQSDLGFLEELGSVALLQELFGRDPFEDSPDDFRNWVNSPSGADYRALTVIRELLEATRDDVPWEAVGRRKTPEERTTWGDGLFELVEEFPESSYAPYAAYYAGCCYSGNAVATAIETVRGRRVPGQRKDRIDEAKQRAALINADPNYPKGAEALSFGAEHGDAYLKPRALYQLALLKGCAGELEEMERLLSKTLEAAPGQGIIQDRVTKLRQEFDKYKPDVVKVESSQRASASATAP